MPTVFLSHCPKNRFYEAARTEERNDVLVYIALKYCDTLAERFFPPVHLGRNVAAVRSRLC